MPSIRELDNYLPQGAYDGILTLLKGYSVQIAIKRARVSKLGDYRPPTRRGPHRISVNGDLNPYSFLLTLLHEIAHMVNWERHRRRVAPHGEEWKQTFREISGPFIEAHVFPGELEAALCHYFINPPASVFSNPQISRLLAGYDQPNGLVLLETLPPDSLFSVNGGRTFRKLQKIRKNYRCYCLDNRKYYTVKPTALVNPLETRQK